MRWNICGRKALLVVAGILLAATTAAEAQSDINLYVRCSFYPQGKGCDQAYQQARRDPSPSAVSVREAFEHYLHYLKPATSVLTDGDKRYLVQNEIRAPFELRAADLAGLHNVINDPSLANDPAAKRLAVNGFIARAVQAELYCGADGCREIEGSPSS
jgi:hypothetical protein